MYCYTLKAIYSKTFFLQRHISHHFDQTHQKKYVKPILLFDFIPLTMQYRILDTVSDAKSLAQLSVDKFTDLFVKA